MTSDNVLKAIDAVIEDTAPDAEPVIYRPTQTSHKTYITCDVQQLVGTGWRSVHIVRDGTDPDSAVRAWLEQHREVGGTYRVARTIKAVVITVNPA